MKILMLCLACVALAVGFAGDIKPHSTVTYAIVPVKDIDKAMLELCAITSMDTLTKSTNGTLAILKWVEWKKPTDPMPPKTTNDISFTAAQLDYNEKLSMYRWAHKATPEIMRKYKQYTHAQILAELAKPEWRKELPGEKDVSAITK